MILAAGSTLALEDIEETVVIGSQIRGAAIHGALAVSVFSAEDVDILACGAETGCWPPVQRMDRIFRETPTSAVGSTEPGVTLVRYSSATWARATP